MFKIPFQIHADLISKFPRQNGQQFCNFASVAKT